MAIIVWPLLLFLMVAFRFRRRFNAEFTRQRMLTWPEATAVFSTRPLELEQKEHAGSPILSELKGGYTFYNNGTAYHGNRLIPDLKLLDPLARDIIERKLNEPGREWKIKYNPADPNDNLLRVDHEKLSWLNVLIYAVMGLIIPLFLLASALTFYHDPGSWLETISLGTAGPDSTQ